MSSLLCCIGCQVLGGFVLKYDYMIVVSAFLMKCAAACDLARSLFVTFCQKLLPGTVEIVLAL